MASVRRLLIIVSDPPLTEIDYVLINIPPVSDLLRQALSVIEDCDCTEDEGCDKC